MRQFKMILIVGSTTLLMIGFQNCSKYQYAQLDTASGVNGALDTNTLPNDTVKQVDQTNPGTPVVGTGGAIDLPSTPPPISAPPKVEPPKTDPPVATNPPGTKPPTMQPPVSEPPVVIKPPTMQPPVSEPPVVIKPPTMQPPVINPPVEDKECKEYAYSKKDKDDKDDNDDNDDDEEDRDNKNSSSAGINCHGGGKVTPPVIAKKCYVNPKEDDNDDDVKSLCDLKNNGKNDGSNGKRIITPDNIGDLKSISNFKGSLVLCGVHLDTVIHTRGNIKMMDSTIDKIEDHKGVVKVIGDSSSKISNSDLRLEIHRKD